MSTNPFVAIKPGSQETLSGKDRFPEAGHLWCKPEIDALTFAWAARRPLLIRGEAGSGKSQIARAAAAVLETKDLLVEVIHPRFEALDLLYRFDVVQRLADAHGNSLKRENNDAYVKPGRLWQAFDQLKAGLNPVLLIDEIDKADADIPNTLLDVLGNRSFEVGPLENKVVSAPEGRMPLIIITTNEERELPAAFVRRCAVLNLNPPKDDSAFLEWLTARGQTHINLKVSEAARNEAAKQVLADRKAALAANYPSVGLAEYIDLLTALDDLGGDLTGAVRSDKQLEWLDTISAYALIKGADQPQNRKSEQQLRAEKQ